ncbi:hypothetical protein [Thalassomonas haliotis]|uniref:Uncharacterized protein n=1 Tax=Thalassomonas haliotis TaxID=485448 RepID=A0ABY7VK84_9GAMM|nr:hypothetical protein [Thalassomonas haliotis]WDE13996.1 hypothetical protein H3N35_11465 [Thalassomonas haliotis]
MAKANELRFNEALETLLFLGSTDNAELYKAYHGVLQWLDHQGNRHQAMDTIGERIALPGYGRFGAVVNAEYRKRVQALLLLLATRHKKTSAELEQISRRLCLGAPRMDIVMAELAVNNGDIEMSLPCH